MKNVFILFIALGIFALADGQTLKVENIEEAYELSAEVGMEDVFYIDLTNTKGQQIKVNWEWTVLETQGSYQLFLCDCEVCHPPLTLEASFGMPANDECEYSIHVIRLNEEPISSKHRLCFTVEGEEICNDVSLNFMNTSSQDVYNGADLSVFPNPTLGELYIDGKSARLASRYELFNVLGAKVDSDRVDNGMIDISDFPSGIYMVRLFDSQNALMTTRKVRRQ